jgi:hypothetical protein
VTHAEALAGISSATDDDREYARTLDELESARIRRNGGPVVESRPLATAEALELLDTAPAAAWDRLDEIGERDAIAADCDPGERHAQTIRNAMAVLAAPDKPWGSHAVARAWLRDCAPTAGVWRLGRG